MPEEPEDRRQERRQSPNLDVKTEKEAKLVLLSAVGAILLCRGDILPGVACFAVMLPWTALARVSAWLAHPVLEWRLSRR